MASFIQAWEHININTLQTVGIARRAGWTDDTFLYMGPNSNIIICHKFDGVGRTFRYTPNYEEITATDWQLDSKPRTIA